MGSVPDGVYHFVDQVLSITQMLSPDERQHLEAALRAAEVAPDREAAAIDALEGFPQLLALFRRMLASPELGGLASVAGIIAFLLTALHFIP